MTRALLQQALTALESLFSGQVDVARGARCADAAEAIRAHLAQPQSEPVQDHGRGCSLPWGTEPLMKACGIKAQEPVAWNTVTPNAPTSTTGVAFTHPAHTEAEVQEVLNAAYSDAATRHNIVRRILKVSKP